MNASRREPLALLAVGLVALAVSGIGPKDRLTWFLEVAPVLIAVPLLVLTWRRFPLTPLLYRLILAHALILMVGGHYTYAEVPLGFWVQDLFGLARNHYDRLGHFAQGFVPAILAREILQRKLPSVSGGWLFFLVVCVCLAFSAFYELLEWWMVIIFYPDKGPDWLGMQGDPWDAQGDMLLALIGALLAVALLSRLHDRSISRLGARSPHPPAGSAPGPA